MTASEFAGKLDGLAKIIRAHHGETCVCFRCQDIEELRKAVLDAYAGVVAERDEAYAELTINDRLRAKLDMKLATAKAEIERLKDVSTE